MQPEPGRRSSSYWSSLSIDAALAELHTCRSGLSVDEAAGRRARHGPNVLPELRKVPWYFELGANFFHLFALLLWIAAGLAWIVGTAELAWVIVAVVVINGLFSYWQEYQAERAVEALKALLPKQVTVRRCGELELIAAAEVVPGDILVLTEGEAIPADARLICGERLRVDNSILTGESRPVTRFAEPTEAMGYTDVALPNLVLAGSTVASGYGEAVVFATGAATEFGRIARLTHVSKERPSPLQREVARITRIIAALSVVMGVVFFTAATMAGGMAPANGFVFALGIIVANVPEGLLPTLTLALAMAVRRMVGRNALVKRLAAVETLGATSIILTDKTGTLTENEMTVREVWTWQAHYRIGGSGYEPRGEIENLDAPARQNGREALVEVLRAAALCCDARLRPPHGRSRRWSAIGDPTEAAILVGAAKAGLGGEVLATAPRLAELPFDSVRKRMTTIQLVGGAPMACVKGAMNQLLPLCAEIAAERGAVTAMNEAGIQRVVAAHHALAERGLRVLAVATRRLPPAPAAERWRVEDVERDLTFVGLIAMEDPPRPEVPAAVSACGRAGIRVIMMTGDDPRTAAAIAREIELAGAQAKIVTGAELDALSDAEVALLLDCPELLFARVDPEHKLRLVRVCQSRGAIVAATGDGVNDAPALRTADIGVAMGATGSDVAREAADIVLADDNFASIVAAVAEGRAVYENVRKFLTYVLVHNVPEAAAFVAFALLRVPLPLSAMQVLAIDLGTEILPALALGVEAPEADVMDRPPRQRKERLLDSGTMARVYLWLGIAESILMLSGYFAGFWLSGWRPGQTLAQSGPLYRAATTMSFAGIVACQFGAAFACRSRNRSVFAQGIFSNRRLVLGVAAAAVITAVLVYTPRLSAVFGFEPLSAAQLFVLATFGPLILLLEEVRKSFAAAVRKWLAARRRPALVKPGAALP